MDNILYWVAQIMLEETVIPEATNEICLSRIRQYIEKQRE